MKKKPNHLFDPIMGKFHLPGKSSDSIFGILKMDDDEGTIYLETLGYFEKSLIEFKPNYQKEEKLLVGHLAHEQLGVLFKFRKTQLKSTNGVISYLKLVPNFVAIGPHFKFGKNRKYLFDTLAIRPQYFDEWSGRNGVRAVYEKEEFMPTLKIASKECITLLKSEDVHIYVIFRASAGGMDSPMAIATYHGYINVEFFKEFSTEVLLAWKARIKRFYDLVTGYQSGIEHAEGLAENAKYQLYFQGNKLSKYYDQISRDEFAVPLKGNEKVVVKIFNQFISTYDSLKVSMDFYFKAMYSELKDEDVVTNFLEYIQALEIAFKWTEQKFVRGKWVELGADSIEGKWASEIGFTFKGKTPQITGLQAVLIVILFRLRIIVEQLGDNPHEIIELISNTRNFYIHDGGAVEKSNIVLSDIPLHIAVQRLRIYTEAFYFHILGISGKALTKSVFGSLRNRAQVGHKII